MNAATPSHADRVLAVLRDVQDVSATARSWRRCLLDHRLDPERAEAPRVVSGAELRQACGRAGRMLRHADPMLDQLHGLVSGLGYHVLMTDRSGIVMARRVPDGDETGCRKWFLWTGTNWSEAIEGTNGVGTCLIEQRPVTVHQSQHFRRRHTALTCTVAPLFDPAGQLVGALDASSFRPDPTGRIVPLVMAAIRDAARRIEKACFHACHPGQLILALPEGPDDVSVPLVALDADRRIVGVTHGARVALGLDRHAGIGTLALGDLLLDASAQEAPSFAAAERSVVAGALVQAQGNVTAAARLLGISRATLHRKIRRLELTLRRYG